jgi:hypothetical protein
VDEFSAGRGKVLVALAFAAWIWLEVEKERPLFEVRVSFSDKALQRTQAAVVLGLKLVVHVSSPLCKRAKKAGGVKSLSNMQHPHQQQRAHLEGTLWQRVALQRYHGSHADGNQ